MGERVGDFLVGFIVGGMVGGMVALLLAPAPGEETRRLIAERAGETAEEARQRGSQYQERGADLLAGKQELVRAAIEEGQQAAARRASEVRESLQARRAGAKPEASPGA